MGSDPPVDCRSLRGRPGLPHRTPSLLPRLRHRLPGRIVGAALPPVTRVPGAACRTPLLSCPEPPSLCCKSLREAFFEPGAAMEVPSLHRGLPRVPEGLCRGSGTIRSATPIDCQCAEWIYCTCHRSAARGTCYIDIDKEVNRSQLECKLILLLCVFCIGLASRHPNRV